MSNAKSTRLFQENSYKRFSNSRYYKWDSDEDLHHSHRRSSPSNAQNKEHCELCRRGLDQERREREQRLAQSIRDLDRKLARSRSENCRKIEHFVNEVN